MIPFRCVHPQRKGQIMSVQSELGLGVNLDAHIVEAWPCWAARQPALARVEDPRRLREWLRDADPAAADDVVYGIAWWASTEGGHDRNAALVLAWLLVPGAAFLARKLWTLTDEIDHMVAAELWLLVCTFPLHRRQVTVQRGDRGPAGPVVACGGRLAGQ